MLSIAPSPSEIKHFGGDHRAIQVILIASRTRLVVRSSITEHSLHRKATSIRWTIISRSQNMRSNSTCSLKSSTSFTEAMFLAPGRFQGRQMRHVSSTVLQRPRTASGQPPTRRCRHICSAVAWNIRTCNFLRIRSCVHWSVEFRKRLKALLVSHVDQSTPLMPSRSACVPWVDTDTRVRGRGRGGAAGGGKGGSSSGRSSSESRCS